MRAGGLAALVVAVLIPQCVAVADGNNVGSGPRRISISGFVTDPAGAALPNATIEITGSNEELIYHGQSDAKGRFSAPALACQPCALRVSREGFAAYKHVVESSTNTLEIHLAIAAVSTAIDVGTSEVNVSAETAENRNTTEIESRSLDLLPVIDQDYIAFMTQFLAAGDIGTNGVTLVVNGVQANGPGVTPSAVQSVKINNNPYSALFAQPGRARLEITTAGGTPTYHGSANFSLRDSVFDARPYFSPEKPQESKHYFEGSLTGPIMNSKKLTFLASGQYDSTDDYAVVNATTPSGLVQASVPQPLRHSFFSGRIFKDQGSGDQFWIGYSFEQRDKHNRDVGQFSLAETGVHEQFDEHEINFQKTTTFSPKWVNQLRFLVGHFDDRSADNVEAPKVRVLGAFTGGSGQANTRRTEAHIDGNDIVTYSLGRHELKFGVDVPDISRRGEDDFSNQLGTYTYASLADYSAGKPQLLTINQGNGHLVFWEATLAGLVEDTFRASPALTVTAGLRYYFQNFFHNIPSNAAPRLGFAWRPNEKSATVIRGGFGIFYDRTGPRAIADLLRYDGMRLRQYVIDDPASPVFVPPATYPISIAELSPSQRIPYTIQWNLGVEQQLSKSAVLTLNWTSERGVRQFRTLDTNAPLPGTLIRPDPQLGQVRTFDSEGRSASNSLELGFRGSITKYFSGQANYTFAKANSDSDGINYIPSNSYRPELDYSRASWDMRHHFYLLGTLNLPFAIHAGTAFQVRSGQPYNITTGTDDNGDGVFNDRPAGLARNTGNGPGYYEWDLRLVREFHLRPKKEGMVLGTSIAAFNVLNNTNFGNYVGVLTSPYFGRPISSYPARRIQLNLSLKF